MTEGKSERLIEWTGERCVPWTDDLQVIYEHYHRYAYAARFAGGKRVLDLASGEGYGAALLAATAAEVVGVDIDEPSVAHATANYAGLANLSFAVGSITDPGLLDGTERFDVITCFEALEHVVEQDDLMRLVHNRLAPGGVFLVSTPDVTVYTHEHGNENPYHVRELTEPEFRALLGESFPNVVLLRQNVAVGSLIVSERGEGTLAQSLDRRDGEDGGDDWTVTEGTPHTYLLAVASHGALDDLPGAAVLVDPKLTLVGRGAGAGQEQAAIADAVRERDAFHDAATRVAADLADATARAEGLAAELALARADLDAVRSQRDVAADELAHQQRTSALLSSRLSWVTDSASRFEAEAVRLAGENAALHADQSALVQKALNRYRGTVERVAPRGSRLRDTYERALGRPAGTEPITAAALSPVGVSTSEQPLASIVIPVHGKWSYTRQCLASIEASHPRVPFEVVVVDDASPDDSAERLAACPGVRLVRAEHNLGFIGACNLGAEQARGELLLFLNNDTEVRTGWLDALVDTIYPDETVGLVGAKLVYPDGTLQECGGIVFSDGHGWNYGRNGDPEDPRYRSVREVDYCSGAAIMVRRALFEELGGFDERFAPAYYEDTDLAFAVRDAGYRTLVQPASVVVHHEGISNGTDLSSGVKRHQESNREVFAAKWSTALAQHLSAEDGPGNLWLARQRTKAGHGGGVVLIADHEVPRPDHDSGSVRMRRLLDELVRLGQRVVFFPNNGATAQPYTGELEQAGVTVIPDRGRQEEFLREAGPSLALAVLSRPNVAWQFVEQIRDAAPSCVIAYDTVDLHFVRLQRQAELAEQLGESARAAVLNRRSHASRELELGLVRAADVALVVSETERDLLAEQVPSARVSVLSNVHEVSGAPAEVDGRTGLLFVGSFNHVPNRDAAKWLAEEIMPRVRKRVPDAVLHLVGSNPPPEISALTAEGVLAHGWVADLDALYATTRISVAPLRFGAGVKGKVGESLGHGVPVVGTPLAFEGMHLRDGEHVLVAGQADELAEAVATLLGDDVLWRRLSAAGREAVAAQFGPDVARETLRSLLDLGGQTRTLRS